MNAYGDRPSKCSCKRYRHFSEMSNKIIEEQRQTVALPFWGIGGLGLLLGISLHQPIGLLAAIGGTFAALLN